MKKNLVIFILLVTTRFSFPQDATRYLYGLQYESFPIADGFVKDCSVRKYIQDDTLFIEVFSQFDCHKLTGFARLENDTLKLSCFNDFTEEQETRYDPETGLHTTTVVLQSPNCCGRCGFILKFKLPAEFVDNPIIFNSEPIIACQDETQYEIVNNDTINRIDKFGMKQGVWVKFYANGTIASLDTFVNDQLNIGYEFNSTGKTIAKTVWSGSQTITIRSISDTTFFNDMPSAPDILRKK